MELLDVHYNWMYKLLRAYIDGNITEFSQIWMKEKHRFQNPIVVENKIKLICNN